VYLSTYFGHMDNFKNDIFPPDPLTVDCGMVDFYGRDRRSN
jgi:hypothetical protein